MERLDNVEQDIKSKPKSGRILPGLILIAFGALLLARKLGADIPHWLFSWEFILIVIGFLVGAKNRFRTFGWMVPVFIGLIFLLDDMIGMINLHTYFWPVLIMIIGLFIILKKPKSCQPDTITDVSDDTIEANAIFGGIKKMVLSKDFKGGEINAIFGGTEVDFSQADIEGRVVLEANQIFGGTKLIIPPHWRIVSEMTVIMGGIEDKRPIQKEGPDPAKTLILKGSCVLGGLEIKSY